MNKAVASDEWLVARELREPTATAVGKPKKASGHLIWIFHGGGEFFALRLIPHKHEARQLL